MTRYILANWESHKTLAEAEAWLMEFLRLHTPAPDWQIIITPPVIYLQPLAQILQEQKTDNVSLACQDISPFPFGSYTGEIAAEMLRDLIDFAMLGHSERRRYCHETNQDIANKVSEAFAAKIQPILCLDQPYAQAQLASMDEVDIDRLIIGYGPEEAIGINMPQSINEASQAIAKIHGLAPHADILYGGSINAANAAAYLNIEQVAGLMVGSASLKVEEFIRICAVAAEN